MPDIVHKINIHAPAEKVYDAIATVDGLKGWWTAHVEGESREGKKLAFRFPETGPVMEVLELCPHELVKWKCVGGEEEWKETILTFEIEERDGVSDLFFAQSGWEDQSSFYAHCNTKWALFMLSLKEFCQSGHGHPYPLDIKIEN